MIRSAAAGRKRTRGRAAAGGSRLLPAALVLCASPAWAGAGSESEERLLGALLVVVCAGLLFSALALLGGSLLYFFYRLRPPSARVKTWARRLGRINAGLAVLMAIGFVSGIFQGSHTVMGAYLRFHSFSGWVFLGVSFAAVAYANLEIAKKPSPTARDAQRRAGPGAQGASS